MKPSRLQGLVDDLLTRHGRFRPVDLLTHTGRLPPRRLEAWQKGDVLYLEDALAGNPARIIEWLQVARDWAEKRALTPTLEPTGLERGRYARKPGQDRLLRTCWTRQTTSPQLDLFAGSPTNAAVTRIRQALEAADARATEAGLSELAGLMPDHADLGDAEQLAEALRFPGQPVADPELSLAWLEHLDPVARRFLGDGATRFTSVLWQHLGASLPAENFDPAKPRLHPSYTALLCQDWSEVIQTVRHVPDFTHQPALLDRLIRAGLESGQRQSALQALAELCWRHAEAATSWLERTDDPALRREADCFFDGEAFAEIEWFPAMLLARGGARLTINADHELATTAPVRACRVLTSLARTPDCTETRQALKHIHEEIFREWLRARA